MASSLICPNLGDPKIRAQFNFLKSVVGEDFAYFVYSKNGGHFLDKDPIVETRDKQGNEIMKDNPLYAYYKEFFNGDERKAILARTITFSKKFLKENKDFKNLSVEEQAKRIHNFLNDSTIEEASADVIQKVTRVFGAKNFISEDIREVARNTEDKITTGRQRLEAYLWFRTSPLSNFTTFANMSSIASDKAFATWSKSAITLYEGSDFSDLYHESWHEFSQKFLTKGERAALYRTFRDRPFTATVNDKQIPYYALTDTQLEEVIAEEFRKFALNKQKPEVPETETEKTTKTLFQKIWDFLNTLFTKKVDNTENTDLSSKGKKANIESIFDKLYSGKGLMFGPRNTQVTNSVLNRSKDFTLNLRLPEEVATFEYSAVEGAEIISFIDYALVKEIQKLTGNNKKYNASFLLNKAIREEQLPELYERVREKLIGYTQHLEQSIPKAPEAFRDEIEEKVIGLKALTHRSSFEDAWGKVMEFHKKFTKVEGFKEDADTVREEKDEVDQTRDSNTYGNKEGVNPDTYASAELLELIRTLPDVYIDSEKGEIGRTGDFYNLPQTGDYIKNKNLILNRASGKASYQEAIAALQEASEQSPQLKYFIDRLPPVEGPLSPEELSLKAQFLQFATMPTVVPYSVKSRLVTKEGAKEKSNTLETATFLENTITSTRLQEAFDQDFVESDSRKYRKTDLLNLSLPEFSYTTVLSDYKEAVEKGFKNHKQAFQFLLDAFGINLFQGVEENKLFDDKGNVKKAGNPNFKERALIDIMAVANNALYKMEFMRLLRISSDVTIRDLAPSIVTSPLGNFIGDVPTRITKVIDNLDATSPIKIYYTKHFKSKPLNNERRNFYETIEKFYNIANSASFLSVENNLEWSVRERNHIIHTLDIINAADNIYELPAELNPLTNPFIESSIWFKNLFDEAGNRRIAKNGERATLEIINYSGYQFGEQGRKTTSLSGDGKMLQELFSFLQDSTVENLRPGAKDSAFAVRISGLRQDRTYFDADDFLTYDKAAFIIPETVSMQFEKYLTFEAIRMFQSKGQSDKKSKLGSEFVIFENILTNEELRERIKNIAAEAQSEQEVKTALLELLTEGPGGMLREFDNNIRDFFISRIEAYKDTLKSSLAVDEEKADLKKIFDVIRPREGSLGKYKDFEIDALVGYYITNYYVHQVEVLHLLVADPTNFNIKNRNNWREVFKRLGPAISPGKQPVLDDQDYSSWNSNPDLARKLQEASGGPSRNYEKTFNYIQHKDVASFSYLDTATKNTLKRNAVIGLLEGLPKDMSEEQKQELVAQVESNMDSILSQDKEADAQAYANLDFIRFYMNSVGEWPKELEDAYNHEVEVLKAIKKFRNGQIDRSEVDTLINKSNLGILTSLKLGFFGTPEGSPMHKVLGKYSVFPLIPSVVFDTNMEDLMFSFFDNQIDFSTFDSGNKLSLPIPSIDFLVPNGQGSMVINTEIKESVKLPIAELRRQQYIAPKFKNSVTLSTQLVKLLFGNFFINGEINPEFIHVENQIKTIQKEFIHVVEGIVKSEKAKIYGAIGAEFDESGNVSSVDIEKFKDWLFSEFDKKDVSSSLYDFVFPNTKKNKFARSLDSSVSRSFIEQTILAAISKKVLRPKMFGEAYIQLASTGFNSGFSRFQKPTDKQLKEFNTSGLRDYRVENGKTQPADVMIAFNPKKHAPLLNLEFEGRPILTLDRLNQALQDEAWVEQHSAKITITGVRIPVQGFNSMEYFRVAKFLPTTAGPVIIVPPSIVTKSGSDFDIDKLFMYEPALDEDGNLYTNDAVDSSDLLDNMMSRIKLIEAKIMEQEKLNASEEMREIGVLKSEMQLIQNGIDDLKATIKGSDEFESPEDAENLEHALSKLQILRTSISNIQSSNPIVGQALENLNGILEGIKELDKFSPSLVKKAASNRMVQAMSDVLSQASLFPTLTKPNDSPILKNLANKYLKMKEDRGLQSGKIAPSLIFDPLTSLQIYIENALGKKSLGVDAKANALHKLYQQAGLTFGPQASLFNYGYQLAANRDKLGHIILGGYKDAANNHLISDIINEFINGHVDIEKEDWINYFNADKVRTPLILQMVLCGTPIEDAITLVNQPIIQHYIKTNNISPVGRVLGQRSKSVESYFSDAFKLLGIPIPQKEGKPDPNLIMDVILTDPRFTRHLEPKTIKDKTYSMGGAKLTVYPVTDRNGYIEMQKDVKAKSFEAVEKLEAQLAYLAQYNIVKKMNETLLELTSVIDFNTTSYRTIQDFHKVSAIKDKFAGTIFNRTGVENILSSSVVSPFNITDLSMSLLQDTFELSASKVMLDNFEELLAREEFKYLSTNDKVKTSNKITNGIVHSLIARHPVLEEYHKKYGVNSGLFDLNNPKNLYAQFVGLFRTTDNEVIKEFALKNRFLKDFVKVDIEKSTFFYPGTIAESKDNDQIVSTQKAYRDALNFTAREGVTEEEAKAVRTFMEDLANAVIVAQGFNIKKRSLQSYLPLEAYLDLATDLSLAVREVVNLSNEDPSFLDIAFKDVVSYIFGKGNKRTVSGVFPLYGQEEIKAQTTSKIVNTSSPSYITNASADIDLYDDDSGIGSEDYMENEDGSPFYPDDMVSSEAFNPVAKLKAEKQVPIKGQEISSNSKGIAGALTNPTELAKSKGNIANSYPVTFRGVAYKDAEAAYQALKKSATFDEGPNNTYNLMVDIISAKLEQHPSLIAEITKQGGSKWILSSTHQPTKKNTVWETKGKNWFIKSLNDAYLRVLGGTNFSTKLTEVLTKFSKETLKTMNDRELANLGLSPTDRQELLKLIC